MIEILRATCLLTLHDAVMDVCIGEQAVYLVASGDDDAALAIRAAPGPVVVEDLHAHRRELPPQLVRQLEVLRRAEPLALGHEFPDVVAAELCCRPRCRRRLAAVGAAPSTARRPRGMLVVELNPVRAEVVTQHICAAPILRTSGIFALVDAILDLVVGQHALHGPCCEQRPTPSISAPPLLLLVIELHAHVAKLLADGVRFVELPRLAVGLALSDQAEDVRLRGAIVEARPLGGRVLVGVHGVARR
mmetsp:Transcript_43071/g.108251  ORF Transcript_43071/g.108251 Transcript_43071/m.108251 type:complete len:247 (+) Transcript_43071:508-1248(+)